MLYSVIFLTSAGKHLDISQANIVSSMYKLIVSAKDSDDLSFGFERDCGRRQCELTDNKDVKANIIFNLCSKMFFVSQKPKKATYRQGYRRVLTRSIDDAVVNKVPVNGKAKIENKNIPWYVKHYTLSIIQKGIVTKQIFCWTLTELRYIRRSVFIKGINDKNSWIFE